MKKINLLNHVSRSIFLLLCLNFGGVLSCSSNLPQLPTATLYPSITENVDDYYYILGPNDSINIFVWGNPEASGSYVIRPDGMISTALVNDIVAAGKTPTQLAEELEDLLSIYIRDPIVSVSVSGFTGTFSENIRIVGDGVKPQTISYKQNMTLFDVMIEIEDLEEFADGNNAKLLRIIDNRYKVFALKIDKLINNGEIGHNVDILPGDIIIIPEAWY